MVTVMSEIKDVEFYKKKKRKILIKIFLMALIFILPLQIATQYYAYSFNYNPLLGTNYNHIYPFWKVLTWFKEFSNAGRSAELSKLVLGLAFVSIVIAVMLAQNVYANSVRLNEKKHGSARFAERKDLEDSGLLPRQAKAFEQLLSVIYEITKIKFFEKYFKQVEYKRDMKHAVVVGGWENPKTGEIETLYHCGVEHVLTNGPTRSGKGVSVVNNTLLTWQGSCFVPDLKGELFQLSAGWRQKHANNIVLRFEVYSPKNSVRWNPLDEIRFMTDYENSDAEALAIMIVDPDGKGLDGSDGHWKKSSKELVKALMMHVLYRRNLGTLKTASLADVDNLMAGVNLDENVIEGGKNPSEFSAEERAELLWKEMINSLHIRHDANGNELPQDQWKPHPVIYNAGMDMLNRQGEEKASVISTTKAYFSTYRDPIVQRNMCDSDFKARDIMMQEKPVTLYMIAQPEDKAKALPIMRLLIAMIVQKNATGLEVKDGSMKASYKHKLLMLIDEFPSFGRIQSIQDGISYVAGYGIKMYLIVQDIMQLKSPDAYGETESITGNCHVQNVFQPNNAKTAEYFSQMAGTTTVTKTNVSISGGRFSVFQSQVSKSSDEVQRPLLTPDEIMRLPPPIKEGEKIIKAGGMLVYVAGFPVIFGKQPLYFKDPVSNARSKVLPPTIRESIRFKGYFDEIDGEKKESTLKAEAIMKNNIPLSGQNDLDVNVTTIETEEPVLAEDKSQDQNDFAAFNIDDEDDEQFKEIFVKGNENDKSQ